MGLCRDPAPRGLGTTGRTADTTGPLPGSPPVETGTRQTGPGSWHPNLTTAHRPTLPEPVIDQRNRPPDLIRDINERRAELRAQTALRDPTRQPPSAHPAHPQRRPDRHATHHRNPDRPTTRSPRPLPNSKPSDWKSTTTNTPTQPPAASHKPSPQPATPPTTSPPYHYIANKTVTSTNTKK
jgi:hypothetical protein